jgi:hypothetical protein
MEDEIENKEVENKDLSFEEFRELWNKAENSPDRAEEEIHYNIVVDTNYTEMKADNYELEYNYGNEWIILYFKGEPVVKIRLKYIKSVY